MTGFLSTALLAHVHAPSLLVVPCHHTPPSHQAPLRIKHEILEVFETFEQVIRMFIPFNTLFSTVIELIAISSPASTTMPNIGK